MDPFSIVIGFIVGLAAGYIIREIISRRRHLKARQRVKMGLEPRSRSGFGR